MGTGNFGVVDLRKQEGGSRERGQGERRSQHVVVVIELAPCRHPGLRGVPLRVGSPNDRCQIFIP